MPNRLNPSDPLCTSLYTDPSSIDFATRVAKIVAKKSGRPTYVGCSVNLGMGARVEEEMEALRVAVDGAMGVLQEGE